MDYLNELKEISKEIDLLRTNSEDNQERCTKMKEKVDQMRSEMLYEKIHQKIDQTEIKNKLANKFFYVRATQPCFDWTVIIEMLFDKDGEIIGNFVDEVRSKYVKSIVSKTGHKLLEGLFGTLWPEILETNDYREACKADRFCYIDIHPDIRIIDDIEPHFISEKFITTDVGLSPVYEDFYKEACEKVERIMDNVEYREPDRVTKEIIGRAITDGVLSCLKLGPVIINAITKSETVEIVTADETADYDDYGAYRGYFRRSFKLN